MQVASSLGSPLSLLDAVCRDHGDTGVCARRCRSPRRPPCSRYRVGPGGTASRCVSVSPRTPCTRTTPRLRAPARAAAASVPLAPSQPACGVPPPGSGLRRLGQLVVYAKGFAVSAAYYPHMRHRVRRTARPRVTGRPCKHRRLSRCPTQRGQHTTARRPIMAGEMGTVTPDTGRTPTPSSGLDQLRHAKRGSLGVRGG